MSEVIEQESALKHLLARMVAARQLSSADAEGLARKYQAASNQSLPTEAELLQFFFNLI